MPARSMAMRSRSAVRGVGSAVLSGTATLVSGTTYRYGFTGAFVDGPVVVGLVAGSLQDLAATPNLNAQDAWSFTVTTPQVIQSLIIDNGDAGFSSTSGWSLYGGQGYQNDIHFKPAGVGSHVANWTFTNLAAGDYQVSVTWFQHANRATDVPYRILDGTTEVFSTTVNQELAPLADAVDSGKNFQNLGGIVTINSGTLVVELSDNANQYIVADAVRIASTQPAVDTTAPTASMLNPTDGASVTTESLNTQGYLQVTYDGRRRRIGCRLDQWR